MKKSQNNRQMRKFKVGANEFKHSTFTLKYIKRMVKILFLKVCIKNQCLYIPQKLINYDQPQTG